MLRVQERCEGGSELLNLAVTHMQTLQRWVLFSKRRGMMRAAKLFAELTSSHRCRRAVCEHQLRAAVHSLDLYGVDGKHHVVHALRSVVGRVIG